MKKHLMVFAVNLLVLLFSTGCYTKAPKQVIRVSTFSTDPVIVTILMKSFTEIEKGHPGVKIQLDDIPYNNYLEKILTEMAAGGAPDIISVEANNFVDLYLKGVFEDLTPYAQKEGVDPKAYYPGVMHRFSPDGKICALPTDTAPFGLVYYNKKIFNEAGVPYPTNKWKWPEPFLSICQKLVKKDAAGKITRWAFADPYGHSFDNFMFSNGGDYVDNPDHPTRMALDSPAALEAIHFRWDLMNTYHVAPTVTELQNFSMGASGAENMFINGFLAMMDSGIWHTPKFLEAKGLDFDVVEFPRGPKGIQGWGSGGSGYAISKGSKNKDLAWQVLKEIAGTEDEAQLAGTGLIQPALIKVAESDAFLKAPGAANKKILLKMPDHSHYGPFVKNWAEINYGMLQPAYDPMWMGKQTPEEAISAVTKKINDKFFKN